MQKEHRELEILFKLKKDGSAAINILKGFPKILKKSFRLTTKPGRKEFLKCAEMVSDLFLTEVARNSGSCAKPVAPLPSVPRTGKTAT